MSPHPVGENLPPAGSESDRAAVAPNPQRSLLGFARWRRTLGMMMAVGMLVLLPVLGVAAFSGRHGCAPGSGLWASYFGGRHAAAGNTGKCLTTAYGGRNGETFSWFGARIPEDFSEDSSEDFSEESGSDALRLASSARGGGVGRGFWYPGQRARRRRNATRMKQRSAAKREAQGKGRGGGDLPNGLANQGNTCYLNSLLQTMYHTPGLKEAVEEAVGGGGCGKAGAVFALSTVFRQLGEGGRPGSTVALTRAMGLDPRVQQDAQEFGRFLFMALEGDSGVAKNAEAIDEMGGLPGALKGLFSGRLVNYIECVDVPHSKEGEEVFYDLPLDVKGSDTLEMSLDRFTEAELMTGENRWRAGEYGLQEARKGVRFVELPPVLQFHLKRFEFDPYLEDLAKINDRFEFPTELDMSPWLQNASSPPSGHPTAPTDNNDIDAAASVTTASAQQPSQKYHLSAVVMHVGGPSAGHYYAYVRYTNPASSKPPPPSEVGKQGGGTALPRRGDAKADAKWVKLDDQRVTEVSEAEVLRDAFGGSGGVYGGPAARGAAGFQGLLGMSVAGGGGGSGGTSSAYMLQYVRDEEAGSPDPSASRRSSTPQASESTQP